MEGKGFWEADHIELNQLSARSNEVKMKEVKMAPLSLELKDRLRWDYEKEHIRGLLQAKTDWVELAYGGRFVSPIFGLENQLERTIRKSVPITFPSTMELDNS